MSKGTRSNLITVPFPRRLNTDTPAPLLAGDETPVLRNVITRFLPNEVTPRLGLTGTGAWGHKESEFGTKYYNKSTWVPYHAFFSADSRYLIVGIVDQDNAVDPAWTFYSPPEAFRDTTGLAFPFKGAVGEWFSGISAPTSSDRIGYVVVDTSTGSSYAETFQGDIYRSQFWGMPAYYDGDALTCKAADAYAAFRVSKYFNSSSTTDQMITGNPLPKATGETVQAWGGTIETSNGGYMTTTPTASVILNNASTYGEFTSAPAVSYQGWYIVTDAAPGANVPKPRFQYVYRIAQHKSGQSNFILDKPYGLGEEAANVPNTATPGGMAVKLYRWYDVPGAPSGGTTLAVFQERIFQARGVISATLDVAGTPPPGFVGVWTEQTYPSPVGDYAGYYGNALFWSKPGAWNKWPDQNFTLVGDYNDPITGLFSLGDQLVIFKANKMYVLNGYDEDSFTVSKVSDVVGCPYPNGMTSYEGTLYFAGRDGVYAYNGSSVVSITEPVAGKGISRLWQRKPWSMLDATKTPMYYWPTLAATPDGFLIVCVFDVQNKESSDNLVYDIRAQAWSEWGLTNSEANPHRVVTAPNGRVWAIHRWFVSEVTNLFNPNIFPNQGVDVVPALLTGTTSNDSIQCELDVFFQPTPGYTARLREIQVDHTVNFNSATNNSTFAPWTFKIATDPDLTLSSTQHSIYARWRDSGQYAFHDPVFFSDRFPETWQREGQTIRIRFTGNTVVDGTYATSMALLGMKFLIDPTRTMGVDNSAI